MCAMRYETDQLVLLHEQGKAVKNSPERVSCQIYLTRHTFKALTVFAKNEAAHMFNVNQEMVHIFLPLSERMIFHVRSSVKNAGVF